MFLTRQRKATPGARALQLRVAELTTEIRWLHDQARQDGIVRGELAQAVCVLSTQLAVSVHERVDLRRAFDCVWTNYLTEIADTG